MREIQVFSSENQRGGTPVSVGSDTTWGQVKRAASLSGDNWTGLGRESRTTYIDDNALVNENDTQIHCYPKKMKAGYNEVDDDYLELIKELGILQQKAVRLAAGVFDISEATVREEAGIDIPITSKNARDDMRIRSQASSLGLE